MSETPQPTASLVPSPYPRWLVVVGLAVVLLGHTQVTLRHLALRLAGVRFGELHQVKAATDVKGIHDNQGVMQEILAKTAVLHDPLGVFHPGELRGDHVWIGDQSYEVVANTATDIEVIGTLGELQKLPPETAYLTGFKEKGGLVKLALRVPGIGFTVADLAFGLALVLLVGWMIRKRGRPASWLPPLPIVVLLIVCFLSIFKQTRVLDQIGLETDTKGGVKELVQYIEVLLVGFCFFREFFRDRRSRCWLIWTLSIGAAAVILVGLGEYLATMSGRTMRGVLDIAEIDSLFGFRYNPARSTASGSESSQNVLAVYLVMLLPVLFALTMAPFKKPMRIGLLVLAGLGFGLILSLPLLLCAVVGVLVVAGLQKQRLAMTATMAGLGLILFVFCAANRHHGKILVDSAAMFRSEDHYGLIPMPLKGKGMGSEGRNWEPWQQKYMERQAVLTAVTWSPLLGHGLGNYQRKINRFYGETRPDLIGHGMSKIPRNLMEKDSHGLYWVQAMETGTLGLAALFLFLCACTRQAFAARRLKEIDDWDRALLTGVAGMTVALLLAAWTGSFLVRGLQFIAIPLLALPAAVLASGRGATSALKSTGADQLEPFVEPKLRSPDEKTPDEPVS